LLRFAPRIKTHCGEPPSVICSSAAMELGDGY